MSNNVLNEHDREVSYRNGPVRLGLKKSESGIAAAVVLTETVRVGSRL